MEILASDGDVIANAETVPLDELGDALISASASITAAQSRLAQAMAVFAAREGFGAGSGIATMGQWCSINLGMAPRRATALADAATAAAEFPAVSEAWAAGQLSTDKVLTISSVATPSSEARWCDMAIEASATQLSRIASAYRRSTDDDAAAGSGESEATCGATWRTRSDGLVELLAVLQAEDAAVVRAALESRMETAWRGRAGDESDRGEAVRSSAMVRRGEALVDLAACALETGPVPIVRGEHTEVVLHVDASYLEGSADIGRCSLTGGGTVRRAAARRLACDAKIRTLVHDAAGRAIDLGRSRRLVSDKQRRLLAERDHGCRFPGCPSTRYVDAHHVVHWAHGGTTDLGNLVSLCNRHHSLQHTGGFTVTADGRGGFEFFDRWGRGLGPPTGRDPGDPSALGQVSDNGRARSGGDPRFDVNLAVTALVG